MDRGAVRRAGIQCYDGDSSREGAAMSSMYDFEMNSIQGESVALSDFEGKVCLVVNVASA